MPERDVPATTDPEGKEATAICAGAPAAVGEKVALVPEVNPVDVAANV